MGGEARHAARVSLASLIETKQPSYREFLGRLWQHERGWSVLSVIGGGLIAVGLVALPVSLAILPLLIFESSDPNLPRMFLGVSTAVVLGCGSIRLLAPRSPWADPIRRRLLAQLEAKDELSEQEEEEQEGILEPVLVGRVRLRLFGGPTSRELKAHTWPILALTFSAVVTLWTPGVEPRGPYFTAIAQVLPVLLIAAFVEGGALYRIFLPVLSGILANDSGAPTHPVFFSFLRYMKGILRLAVLGEIAALIALAMGTRSMFLGVLSAVAALGVALSLIHAFTERLNLDQFKRTRSPGGWDD
ncbi:MAG TPA: hypothetical protein VIS51_00285 [Solirubrobacterales bacterium]